MTKESNSTIMAIEFVLKTIDGMIENMVTILNNYRSVLHKQPRNPKARHDFYSARGAIILLRLVQEKLCDEFQIEWHIYDVDLLE